MKRTVVLATVAILAVSVMVVPVSAQTVPPPFAQMRSGIPLDDIVCNQGKVLMQLDDMPYCIKTGSVAVLQERGFEPVERQAPILDAPLTGHDPDTDRIIDDPDSFGRDLHGLHHIAPPNNEFAFDLYRQFATNDNLFFSPWSVFSAFGVLYEGATGNAHAEMTRVFGFPVNQTERHAGFGSASYDAGSENPAYELRTANALWVSDSAELHDTFTDTAATVYNSTVDTVDFLSIYDVDRINEWVSDRTHGKIDKILEYEHVDELTLFVITNAVYFNGTWVVPFDESRTIDDADFYVNDTNTVKTPMMRMTDAPFGHSQEDGFQILKMPYNGDRLSMIVLLPDQQDGIKKLEQRLTRENFEVWMNNLTEDAIVDVVALPKFKMETGYDLKEPLTALGMPSPFDPDIPGMFSNITDRDAYISKASHKAFVDVNEHGTEAAAATSIVGSLTSFIPPETVFVADHPFVFVIYDDYTASILFMGKMANPAS